MKKFMKSALLFGAVIAGTSTFAQIQDEENVTVTMELVPILQLNMNTPDQVNFVFDEISEYIGGITQYGATILTVSSTVNWDLFATGTSAAHQAVAGDKKWDYVVGYGPTTPVLTGAGARNELPLTALELHQFPSAVVTDALVPLQLANYGGVFSAAVGALPGTWPNNIYVSTASAYLAPPTVTDPYIAGGAGVLEFVNGGSYLTQTAAVGASDYYFVIDYRIVPGLPAIFPKAGTTVGIDASHALVGGTAFTVGGTPAPGAYAKPGVYTMNAKYLLVENQ